MATGNGHIIYARPAFWPWPMPRQRWHTPPTVVCRLAWPGKNRRVSDRKNWRLWPIQELIFVRKLPRWYDSSCNNARVVPIHTYLGRFAWHAHGRRPIGSKARATERAERRNREPGEPGPTERKREQRTNGTPHRRGRASTLQRSRCCLKIRYPLK